MIPFRLLTVLFLLSASLGICQNKETAFKVGQAPPALHLERLLSAPVRTFPGWGELTGKVVVIEFWATWCPPCVSAIPHMNELVKEFADQPVVFLSVTDDDEERVKRFLKDRPLMGWIGLDPARSNWSAFDVASIPHTVVIGWDGTVVGATYPDKVTTEVLRKALVGEPQELPAKENRQSNFEWDREEVEWRDGVPPLFQIVIKPIRTATAGYWLRPEGTRLTADGVGLRGLVPIAYETDAFHLDWRLPDSDQGYRVAVVVPTGSERRLLPLFQQALVSTFGIQARWEMEEKEVYVLRVSAGRHTPAPSSGPKEQRTSSMLRGKITARGQPISELCGDLTSALELPIVDETGLVGNYDWALPYQPGQPAVLLQAVREKLGLELVKTRRAIRMLVVEPAKRDVGRLD